MGIVGIVQARMGSTRLAGKVLQPLGGRSVLGRVVHAARQSGVIDEVVVATSTDPADDAVIVECERLGVASHRGPVDDVLTRFIGALDAHPAEVVARFTADSPMLDPEIIALGARTFLAAGVDYLNTSLVRRLPLGLDVEFVTAKTLRAVNEVATDHDRVHVTSYVYSHPDDFRVLGLVFAPNHSHLRLTLDTPEDWAALNAIVAHFGDATPSASELVEWLDKHPEVVAINAHIEQRALQQG